MRNSTIAITNEAKNDVPKIMHPNELNNIKCNICIYYSHFFWEANINYQRFEYFLAVGARLLTERIFLHKI